MRFEKLLYEKIINTAALGRNRTLQAPQKFFTDNAYFEFKAMSHWYFSSGIRKFMASALEPLLAWIVWRHPLEICHERGLAFEDIRLFTERDLRREILHEHIIRQTCHPYQQLLFRKRRARYYKVERAVRGFVAPDHVRREAESRLLSDTGALRDEWETHKHAHFFSDMTPSSRTTAMASRFNPIEMFNIYGLLRHEAWDRYFYNESEYEGYDEQELAEANQNPFGNFNLETDEGRRSFEAKVNKFIDLYPCTVVEKGQQFNFQEFYAQHAIENGKDTSKMDPQLVAELRAKLDAENVTVSSEFLPESETAKVGKSFVGTVFPRRMQKASRKIMM